ERKGNPSIPGGFKEGPATHALSRIIPLENIQCAFWLYRTTEEILGRFSVTLPYKELIQIKNALKKLEDDQWLSKGATVRFTDVLNEETNVDKLFNLHKRKGVSNLRSFPFNLLLYVLVNDIMHYEADRMDHDERLYGIPKKRVRPHFKEIGDCFMEQSPARPGAMTLRAIGKRYSGIRREDILSQFKETVSLLRDEGIKIGNPLPFHPDPASCLYDILLHSDPPPSPGTVRFVEGERKVFMLKLGSLMRHHRS
ncbi:MAG TPA: hypothetical protein VMT62_08575, partial [Syntrophorhabdaceae bacterium]|nr:hypothetical protein [Syntrophorhabdaceae bacterium]